MRYIRAKLLTMKSLNFWTVQAKDSCLNFHTKPMTKERTLF